MITKFFEIEPSEIFETLKSVINFQTGYIYYTNPTRLEYSYGQNDAPQKLTENLKIKNTVFGEIIITGEKFSNKDRQIFKTCSVIIANLLKDKELSEIMKLQAKELQNGYLKVKEAEQVKTKFISHISHELRTPLNSILGFSDLLENEFVGPLNEKQKEYINDIKISSLHLLEMINEILDMSKIEAGAVTLNKREFEIQQAIDEVVNILKPLLIKKNITLINNVKNHTITADYQKFQQILFNLLSNAIKYTKDQIIINSSNDIIVSIEDNGAGIDKKNFDKIFEKFEQLGNGKEASTGLGLAITKELAKLHNWDITVESAKEKGSKFILIR